MMDNKLVMTLYNLEELQIIVLWCSVVIEPIIGKIP